MAFLGVGRVVSCSCVLASIISFMSSIVSRRSLRLVPVIVIVSVLVL